MRKYEFTGETKVVSRAFREVTLYRIRAVVQFGHVEAGKLGGWIEKEENLSGEGNAWVCGNAKVYGDAEVCGDAKVCGNAEVYGDAKVYGDAEVCGNAEVYGNAWVCGNAKVYGDAEVCGNAEVYGDAEVCGNAKVYGDAEVYGDAKVYGDAEVCGNAEVYGNAWVCGNAKVCGNAEVYGNAWVCGNAKVYGDAEVCGNAEVFTIEHILVIGPVGSRNAFTTFYRDKDSEISVKCGCFNNKIDKFLEKIDKTHGESKHALVYKAAVEVAKLQIDLSLIKPLEVGDKVRIINSEQNDVNRNWNDKMEPYLGTVMTIEKVIKGGYRMKEDNCEWFWDNFRIAGQVKE